MRILVIGGGGREHALVWKIAQSPLVQEIVAAPGNAGIASAARCVPLSADDVTGLSRFAVEERFDLVVVGPENPLTLGLADRLADAGVPVFGPSRAAAQLEGSKWFAKDLMLRARIPTARAWLASSRDEALGRAREVGFPVVVKADGLAAGKGVVIAEDAGALEAAVDDALVRGVFGPSGQKVVIEECLEGEEVSVLALVDGRRTALLAPSQDHKRVHDGDEGPNTGGMGAYAPAPLLGGAVLEDVRLRIIEAAVEALEEHHGVTYRGVLYAGLMMTAEGPKVLEFNCRFGDPEAQAVLPLLDGDIVEIMLSVAHGTLDPSSVRTRPGAAACVVLAAGGYPGHYENGKEVRGLAAAEAVDGVLVFHAGTALQGERVVTAGGRVLGVTGVGHDLPDALGKAYAGVYRISFDGAHCRKDIGYRALRSPAHE
jgi:phosphoribosylamine--glycine ligase